MAFEKSKGLLSVATSYSGGSYQYEKIDGFIQYEGLTSAPDQMQDLDSYVNAKGHLKRTVLEHTRSKLDFNTVYMDYHKMKKFVSILRRGMKLGDGECNVSERKIRIRYYDEWTDDYEHAFVYVPDVEFQYGGTYKGYPMYQPTRFAFIEY